MNGGALNLELIYNEFHEILMGETPNKLYDFIEKHGLRHTYAIMYVNAGVDYKIIQERLGHENITITINIYIP